MSNRRFYTVQIDDVVTLTDAQARHLVKVLRLREGESVELFDGKGTVATAVVEQIQKKKVLLRVLQKQFDQPRNNQRIVIASSIAKGERFEWLVAKCTELGVDEIWPILFERTVKQAKGTKILERWRKISVESCKQCGRSYLPVIREPQKITETIAQIEGDENTPNLFFGDPNAETGIASVSLCSNAIVFVGPEGGFTEHEIEAMRQIGAKAVRLGGHILRVETAAVAFAAVLASLRNADAK